jgi:hypothetical protein
MHLYTHAVFNAIITVTVAKKPPHLRRRDQIGDDPDTLFLHSECGNLGEARRFDGARRLLVNNAAVNGP